MSDDTISRQAAIKEIKKCRFVVDAIERIRGLPSAQQEHATCYLGSPCEYQNINMALPSAQPELIRCKDCEYWYPEEDDEYGHCQKHDFWTSETWYFADGDRRET